MRYFKRRGSTIQYPQPRVNWANTITRGMHFLYTPAARMNLVTGRRPTTLAPGALTYKPGYYGQRAVWVNADQDSYSNRLDAGWGQTPRTLIAVVTGGPSKGGSDLIISLSNGGGDSMNIRETAYSLGMEYSVGYNYSAPTITSSSLTDGKPYIFILLVRANLIVEAYVNGVPATGSGATAAGLPKLMAGWDPPINIGSSSGLHLAGAWNRDWTPGEVASMTANPFQVLK